MHDRDAAHEIGAPIRRHARLLCIAGLSMSLGLAGVPAAYAASARTDSELARLANEVTQATSAYSRARAKSVDLQGQVDALADEIGRALRRAGVSATDLGERLMARADL